MLSFKSYLRFYMVLSFLLFFSCQSEIAVEQYTNKETILKTSPLTTYVERVAMQNTSQDDMVDGAACFMVKFPYSITVNTVQITLTTNEDYRKVENAIKQSLNDNDIVYFNFPITLVFNNYVVKTVSNQVEFNNQIKYCDEHKGDFLKINCFNFVFPITINSYDSNKQVASSISINDAKSLYNFIHNLVENQFVAFDYPIIINNEKGESITINNNNELEDSIKKTLDNCTTNVNTLLNFEETITTGSWGISYFYDDDENTVLYSGFIFVFKNDKTVTATKLGVTLNGQWETKIDNGNREFKIIFNSEVVHQLDIGWKLFEFNASQIRFRGDFSESGYETDYLYFTKVN